MKGEHQPGALPIARQLILAGLTLYWLLLPRWKQSKEPPKTNRSKGIIVDPVRLATCLDRSVAASGAIAFTVSPCLPWRKRLSLTERVARVERPQRRAAHRLSELSSLAGGIDRLKALTPGRRPEGPLSDECAPVALHAFGEGALAGLETAA